MKKLIILILCLILLALLTIKIYYEMKPETPQKPAIKNENISSMQNSADSGKNVSAKNKSIEQKSSEKKSRPEKEAVSDQTSTGTKTLSDITDTSSSAGMNSKKTVSGDNIKKRLDLEDKIFRGTEEEREIGLEELSLLAQNGEGKDLLMKMWNSGDEEMLKEVLAIIPHLNEKDIMEFVMSGLDKPIVEIQTDCLGLLRDFGEVSPDPAIEKALSSKEQDVLDEADSLLTYFSDREIYISAAKAIEHPSQEIRESAVSYLEDRYEPRAVEMLLAGLNSSYKDVSEGCGNALRFVLDADIDSNDYNEWNKWWNANKQKWTEQQAKEEEEE